MNLTKEQAAWVAKRPYRRKLILQLIDTLINCYPVENNPEEEALMMRCVQVARDEQIKQLRAELARLTEITHPDLKDANSPSD